MLKKTKDVADQNSYALDQQYQGMLDNAVEAIIIIDSKGLIQFANKATTKLFGWTTAQLIGKNVSLLMPSRFATKHDGYLKNYTDTGKAQIIGIGREVEGLKKNGTTFPMHLSVSEFIWNGEKLYSGFVHDLTQSKAAEKLLQKTAAINALLHHTAESANAATSVDSAIAACLKDVCSHLDWQFGIAWLPAKENPERIVPLENCYSSNDKRYAAFKKKSLTTSYKIGSENIGKIFNDAKTQWHSISLAQGPRAKVRLKTGLRTLILTPVMKGRKVTAILEFATEQELSPDKDLIQALKQISTQLGRVFERQELTERLEQSEARFRDFAASTADRFWQTDKDHRFTFVTDNSKKRGQRFAPKVMIGKTRWEMDHANPNSDFWRAHKADMDAHRPFYNLHYSRTFPNGNITYFRSTGMPIFDDANNFAGYRGTNLDETEDVLATQKASETQRRLLEFMEEINAGFILWNAENKFVACNSLYRRLYGAASQNLQTGDQYQDYLKEISLQDSMSFSPDESKAWMAARIADMKTDDVELVREMEDGKWFMIRRRRLADGYTAIFHFDITDQKKSETALRHALDQAEIASHSKSEFLANMSHELRTPLNAIIGFSSALLSNIFGQLANSKQAEYIDAIHESGQHLLGLINDILDVSTIEEGKLTLQNERVDLATLSVEVLRMVNRRATEQGCKIINKFNGNIPDVFGDTLRLKQILVNLLSNAVKFTPKGGKITLNARQLKNGTLRLSVKDTGIGMSEEEIEVALTRFGKVSAATNNAEGTGLGIPLARGLIEAHDGSLKIRSKPGAGTTVTLNIPKDRVLAAK